MGTDLAVRSPGRQRPWVAPAALVAAALVPLAADDPERYASLAALLAVLVGAVFLVARLIRLGWVADYFSRAVLIGYQFSARGLRPSGRR